MSLWSCDRVTACEQKKSYRSTSTRPLSIRLRKVVTYPVTCPYDHTVKWDHMTKNPFFSTPLRTPEGLPPTSRTILDYKDIWYYETSYKYSLSFSARPITNKLDRVVPKSEVTRQIKNCVYPLQPSLWPPNFQWNVM